jgi:hypothetical protein
MAAGVVSGAAALLADFRPAATNLPMRLRLQFGANRVTGGLVHSGSGTLNVVGSLDPQSRARAAGEAFDPPLVFAHRDVWTSGISTRAQTVVWGNTVVWGSTAVSGNTVVWGNTLVWGGDDTVVWGSSDTVVWGSDDTVVWGSSSPVASHPDNPGIWGSADTVVWGADDTVVWGSGDTVVWGSDHTVVWGSDDTVVWGSGGIHGE